MDGSVTQTHLAALVPQRQAIARERQPFEMRIFSLGFARDRFVAPRHDGWDRLIAAKSGAGMVRLRGAACALSAERALWVREEDVEIVAGARLDLRVAYVRPWNFGQSAGVPMRAVTMTALGRELLERGVEVGWLDPTCARDARLLAIIADELEALPDDRKARAIAFPSDVRALRVAEYCSAHAPRDIVSAPRLCALAGCSARTLERLFIRDTMLGVVAWQRRYRLVLAAAAIAAGSSVTDAGLDAGYGGTSAFITAFRRAFGATPGAR